MKKKLFLLVMVLGIAPLANALMVRLSFDGVNPAPDAVDVFPEQILPMYIISDGDGESYWEEFYDPSLVGTISNLQSYPAAGDLASISTIEPGYFRVTADDSAGNIEAGKHFSFDLTIIPDASPGDWAHFHMFNGPIPDDTIRLNVVPEPATVLLLGLGGLALLRKRRA